MKHLELFSGVGGFRMAMDYIQKDLGITNDIVGYSEIDAKAILTYNANYKTSGELVLGDIVSFIKNEELFSVLPDIDIITGGFPCQTFSMMGKQQGFEEDRGQMFFRIMDVVQRKKPRYILLENVKNLITHDNKRTYKRIKSELESEGYIVHQDVFNTSAFGLPQTRNRVIIFARKKEFGDFDFSFDLVKEHFDKIDRKKCSIKFYDTVLDVLSKSVDSKYYLSERIKPTILSNGSGNFISNSDIDQMIARPLTASMHKMHRACQDNYYSDLFISSRGNNRPSEFLDKENLAKIAIRKLTPQEAFMLQGFPKNFVQKAYNSKVADGALYKQAGNAVSVNTIYAILHYLVSNKIIKE